MKKIAIIMVLAIHAFMLAGCGELSEKKYLEKVEAIHTESLQFLDNVTEILNEATDKKDVRNEVNLVTKQIKNYREVIAKVKPPEKYKEHHEQLLNEADSYVNMVDKYLVKLLLSPKSEDLLQMSIGAQLFMRKAEQHREEANKLMDQILKGN